MKQFVTDESWARFNYLLLKHTSWLTRRVETWSYVGDAQWCRTCSYDLNLGQIEEIWESAGEVGTSERIEMPERDMLGVPLFDIDKRQQFLDFDLRDENGCALHLMMRGVSAQFTISALVGAMQVEHANEPEFAIHFEDPIASFLLELFSSNLPPCELPGHTSSSDGDYVAAVLADALKRLDRKVMCDRLPNGSFWTRKTVDATKEKLVFLVENSPIFRYFFRTYSMKWLACAEVRYPSNGVDGDAQPSRRQTHPEIIKSQHCVTRDVSKSRTRNSLLRDINPFSRGVTFEVELDGIGVGEVDHTTVRAPAGTYISPIEPIKDLGKETGPFYVKDDLSIRTQLDVCPDDSPEAHALGTLTPGHATIKTKKDWVESRDQPKRRLPVDGSSEHRYLLSLNIAPRLGLRAVGYLALFALSAFAFLLTALSSDSASPSEPISLGTVLVVASLLITALSNREEESFIRKLLFRLPRWLSFACIAVDIAGFGYLAIVLKQQSICCDFSPPIPVAGLSWGCFAFCAIALLWCLLWTLNYIIRKRLWTSNAEAFKTFQVNYDALNEPRTFDFSED